MNNILYHIFRPDDLFRSKIVTKSYISCHPILLVETILICNKNSTDLTLPQVELTKLDFNKASWEDQCVALKSLSGTINEDFICTRTL